MIESSANAGMRRQPRQARSQERVTRILDVAAELFVAQGYGATTTNAIATQAQVPIGSLYQFFPDKAAILQALTRRYNDLLYDQLVSLDPMELTALPLAEYVNRLIDTTNQFFTQHPGYYAIFMEAQGSVPELEAIEAAADTRLIHALANSLAEREPKLNQEDYGAIAFVLVKTTGTLLWLSLGQEPPFRQRLVTEAKRFALNYLQGYFHDSDSPV